MSTPAAFAAKKMFATSTKTATFLLTNDSLGSDVWGSAGAIALLGGALVSDAARRASHRGHGSLDTWTGQRKSLRCPAAEGRRIFRADCLHEGAALVARRADEVLEEGVRHAVRIMVGVDDQEVDRADETTSPDRGSKGQNGPAHDDA